MSRNISDYSICTLGSHSALQILKGAKDEGFRTIAVCEKGKSRPYTSFRVADEIITVEKFEDFFSIEPELIKRKAIVIPHGTFVSTLETDKIEQMRAMHFGNKRILRWEFDRGKTTEWLLAAGVRIPKVFEDPKDIDRPVIVKFHGARGGEGYFFVSNSHEFRQRIKQSPKVPYMIQEYIIGVPVYIHYFYSPLTGELEILGFDKRYESNVDSIGRIAARDQLMLNIKTSYTIAGNLPMAVRESLLPEMFDIGEGVIKASKSLEPPGLYGPFCVETIVTPSQEIHVFEISARIVAGTNPYLMGSPYSQLRYSEPMSCGRRIALELKNAIRSGRIEEVLG